MILEMLNPQSSIGCLISVILLIFSLQNEQIVILEEPSAFSRLFER